MDFADAFKKLLSIHKIRRGNWKKDLWLYICISESGVKSLRTNAGVWIPTADDLLAGDWEVN